MQVPKTYRRHTSVSLRWVVPLPPPPPLCPQVDKGLVRTIGVSNFSIKKLEALISTARITPAVNQVRTARGRGRGTGTGRRWGQGAGAGDRHRRPFRGSNPRKGGRPAIFSNATPPVRHQAPPRPYYHHSSSIYANPLFPPAPPAPLARLRRTPTGATRRCGRGAGRAASTSPPTPRWAPRTRPPC